jgi:hypothetical protein
MTNPIFSVEIEGKKSMLRLRKDPDAPFVVEKALNERRSPGLGTSLDPKDLAQFKDIAGKVDVVFQSKDITATD